MVCTGGSMLPTAYHHFTVQLYDRIRPWTLVKWMAYKRLKRMKRRFRSQIWHTYTVNQSAILSMFAFALNYVVVLLQTESYGTHKRDVAQDRNGSCFEND